MNEKGREVQVRCVLVVGGNAELLVPGQDEPARWPAKVLAEDTGLTVGQLPGREFVAVYRESLAEGRTFSGFRLPD